MPKTRIWIGIDIGESISLVSVIDYAETEVAKATLPTEVGAVTAFFNSLHDFEIAEIAVESGAAGMHLIRNLKDEGLPVVVYQTRRASQYLRIRLNKTDGNDARGLAEIAKLGRSAITTVHVKSREFQKLRSELVFRHKLTLHRVACEAMIRSFIKLNGGALKRVTSARTLDKHVNEELARMKEVLGVDLAADVQPLLRLASGLREFLATVDARLIAYAKENPTCSRFLAIPGVGPVCAISFYSAIEDPHRFARASDVGPYLGLAPSVAQSGKNLKHGRISKRGNKLTRSHLTLAAGVLLVHCGDSPLNAWGKSLANRSSHGKARVALARKLAVLMLAIWKSGKPYDPLRLAQNGSLD